MIFDRCGVLGEWVYGVYSATTENESLEGDKIVVQAIDRPGNAYSARSIVGLDNEQPLHHFLSESPWDVQDLRYRRLALIYQALAGREIIVIVDDTGDRKKGNTTDYVKRQYIGNLGKVDNGIVSVTIYC